MLSVVPFSPWAAASLTTGLLDLGAWCPHCGQLLTGLPGSLTGRPQLPVSEKTYLTLKQERLCQRAQIGELS